MPSGGYPAAASSEGSVADGGATGLHQSDASGDRGVPVVPFLSGIGLACSGEYLDARRVLYGLSWSECSILGRQSSCTLSRLQSTLLVAVSSHWVSLTGLALALTALISWMFVLPVHVRGHAGNPYIGILVFI